MLTKLYPGRHEIDSVEHTAKRQGALISYALEPLEKSKNLDDAVYLLLSRAGRSGGQSGLPAAGEAFCTQPSGTMEAMRALWALRFQSRAMPGPRDSVSCSRNSQTGGVHISLGMDWRMGGANLREAILRADELMYQEKSGGATCHGRGMLD